MGSDALLRLPSMRAALFDLDGTLVDSSRDLIAAANACFEGMGHGAGDGHGH